MSLLFHPKYWATISSGEQPKMLRVFESPTLKVWDVYRLKSFASERYTRTRLQTVPAEPRNGLSPTHSPRSDARKKIPQTRRLPALGRHEHNNPTKEQDKHLGLEKGQGQTHGETPLRTVFVRDNLIKNPSRSLNLKTWLQESGPKSEVVPSEKIYNKEGGIPNKDIFTNKGKRRTCRYFLL